MIVNVGEAHIVVNLKSKSQENGTGPGLESEEGGFSGEDEVVKGAQLKLKIFGGPTNGEVL